MSLSTATTPTAQGDTSSGTTRTIAMPASLANGDAAILAVECAVGLTPTLTPEGGWTSPWTLVVSLSSSGKCLHVWKATNLVSGDSGKLTTISTGATSTKVARGILPIRGGSVVDIVSAHAEKDGTSTSVNASTSPVVTAHAGCGAVHVLAMRRNDGVAGDAFTTLDPDGGQGITEDLNAFTGNSGSTSSLSALIIAHDWTPRASGATISGGNFTADKAGVHYGVTLAIRPGNIAPVAYAGPDVEVDAGDVAYITAASATDADGSVVSTVWSWVSYPTVSAPTITGGTTLTPHFTTTTPGEYVLRLTATDNNSPAGTHTDDVSVWAVTTTPEIRAITTPGGWTAVGAASIVAALGDANPATYAQSSGNPAGDTLIGELEPIPAGAKSFTTTIVNDVDSPMTSATLTLINRDTGTTVATKTEPNLTTTERDVVWILNGTENGAVLDPHKLNIRIVANTNP